MLGLGWELSFQKDEPCSKELWQPGFPQEKMEALLHAFSSPIPQLWSPACSTESRFVSPLALLMADFRWKARLFLSKKTPYAQPCGGLIEVAPSTVASPLTSSLSQPNTSPRSLAAAADMAAAVPSSHLG